VIAMVYLRQHRGSQVPIIDEKLEVHEPMPKKKNEKKGIETNTLILKSKLLQ
jgi:hypothetical protein